MVNADSEQAVRSSERSDDSRGLVILLWMTRCDLTVFFVPLKPEYACGACGRVCGVQGPRGKRGLCVFHRAGAIHRLSRMSATHGLSSTVQDTAAATTDGGVDRPHPPDHGPDHDFPPLPGRRVFGSRMVGPLSVSLCARWMRRSQIASATLGSPIAA